MVATGTLFNASCDLHSTACECQAAVAWRMLGSLSCMHFTLRQEESQIYCVRDAILIISNPGLVTGVLYNANDALHNAACVCEHLFSPVKRINGGM